LGIQNADACIFARFTRKMHGNDTMLEDACLHIRLKIHEQLKNRELGKMHGNDNLINDV
jgi:hypothetical protein